MSRILVIAGTDSSGGAGLSRDIEMAQLMGCSVSPIVTAVTAQTNTAVLTIHTIPPEIVAAQIRAACDPAGPAPKAIKIGMLGSLAISSAVAQALPKDLPIVLDPVLKSSSGGNLMTASSLSPLLPHVTLLTPNLQESAHLSQSPERQDLRTLCLQAQRLRSMGPQAVLIKGGHGDGHNATDHLFQTESHRSFSQPRLSAGKRGTGCSLATAISCELAKGHDLETACSSAKEALSHWLAE